MVILLLTNKLMFRYLHAFKPVCWYSVYVKIMGQYSAYVKIMG